MPAPSSAMYNDDLKMLEFAVNGGRYMWLMLVGLPLLPIVLWAAHRAGATRSRLGRAAFAATALMAAIPFLVGAISFVIGSSKPFFGARAMSRSSQCTSNLKELSRSVMLYANDYDYTFPPADRWADHVAQRTTLTSSWFLCPSSDAKFGYAFNRALGKVRMDDVVEPTNVVLLFESDAEDRNKSGTQRDLAPPPKRHVGMTNVALADGHVRQYRPSRERPIYWDPKAFTRLEAR